MDLFPGRKDQDDTVNVVGVSRRRFAVEKKSPHGPCGTLSILTNSSTFYTSTLLLSTLVESIQSEHGRF